MCPLLWRATFPVTRNGLPLSKHPLLDTIKSGIQLSGLPGRIPEFTEISACNAANYTYFGSWAQLEPEQQAIHIAHYIVQAELKQHVEDAQNRAQKQAAARSKRRGRT